MTEIVSPRPLDEAYAAMLQSVKSDFVADTTISQHGAVSLAMHGWPGWPAMLAADEPVIETYVAGSETVQATSDNEPFVTAWMPLIEWLNTAVRSALSSYGIVLDDIAYATASLTATDLLEGTAHMDDDSFMPTDGVSVVAIIGQLVGPRVAIGHLTTSELRPMGQVQWGDRQLLDFEANVIDHCSCAADQLVLFPQFGQLHAGPAAAHVAHLATHRQMLVYRAKVL